MSGISTDVRALGDATLEALVEIMFLAASADGEFSPVERSHFLKSVESLTDGRLAVTRLMMLLADAKEALLRDGRLARLHEIKARLPEPNARKVALQLAVQVTNADGIIRTSERELIMEIAEALEIDRDEAANLVSRVTA
jgi:tellurite resistance protein